MYRENKEEIWLSPMTKAPTPAENVKQAKWQHKKRHKKFDYTEVADDIGRSVGVTTKLVWLTCFRGPTFPLPATAV